MRAETTIEPNHDHPIDPLMDRIRDETKERARKDLGALDENYMDREELERTIAWAKLSGADLQPRSRASHMRSRGCTSPHLRPLQDLYTTFMSLETLTFSERSNGPNQSVSPS